MKVLLVGFQPRNSITYPHLHQVAEYLLGRGATYALFRERGYFLGDPIDHRRKLWSLLSAAYVAWTICIDTFRLLLVRLGSRTQVVVAVDNLSYVVASKMFPRVVLWSHDFVTNDQLRSTGRIQRFLKRQMRSALLEQGRLVIQDDDRLKLFCTTYLGEESAATQIDAFLLPVSLMPIDAPPASESEGRPVLMQIGGISATRSRSDELLRDYQSSHRQYSLAFHGYVEPSMVSAIAASAVIPWTSSLPLPPGDVYKVVRKCSIGVIAYKSLDQNFFHVARASGQLAEFLRCGKPVITLGRSSIGPMLHAEQAGIEIDDVAQLPDAVRHISDNLDSYTANCRRLFDSTYNLAPRLPALCAWLSGIADR